MCTAEPGLRHVGVAGRVRARRSGLGWRVSLAERGASAGRVSLAERGSLSAVGRTLTILPLLPDAMSREHVDGSQGDRRVCGRTPRGVPAGVPIAGRCHAEHRRSSRSLWGVAATPRGRLHRSDDAAVARGQGDSGACRGSHRCDRPSDSGLGARPERWLLGARPCRLRGWPHAVAWRNDSPERTPRGRRGLSSGVADHVAGADAH